MLFCFFTKIQQNNTPSLYYDVIYELLKANFTWIKLSHEPEVLSNPLHIDLGCFFGLVRPQEEGEGDHSLTYSPLPGFLATGRDIVGNVFD